MGAKDLKETISSLKRSDHAIKICPKCCSTDVSIITLTGYISQPYYLCNKCGYQSTIFPEVSLKEAKMECKEKNMNLADKDHDDGN